MAKRSSSSSPVLKLLRPDFCVLGAGSGGLAFAAGAVQMGASVVLVEQGKMGGDCLNTGCVPSKSLIAAARMAWHRHHSEVFGIEASKAKVDFKKVMAHVHKVIAAIAPHDSVERFEKLGVQVIQDTGKFIDSKTVGTQKFRIHAKRFVIATGSRPFVPPIPGLSEIPFLTNETIFELKVLPKTLLVIGGGPIGIELAQAFQRLGTQVTIVEAFSVLPKDDGALTQQLGDILKAEGIQIFERVKIEAIKQEAKSIVAKTVLFDGSKMDFTCSHVLVAAGRRPTVASLNLEAAQVRYSPKGIDVDPCLRTTNNRIYAIGDCTGGYQFTHVAGYQAGLVIRNGIFGMRAKVQPHCIPWVTYTDPELAHVGYTEDQLKMLNKTYRVISFSFSEIDRAQADHRPEGGIKIWVSPKGKIWGVSILGSHAGELILPWVLAIQNNLKISAMAGLIAPYPTFSEISKRGAGQYYVPTLFGARTKKMVQFLMGWKT